MPAPRAAEGKGSIQFLLYTLQSTAYDECDGRFTVLDAAREPEHRRRESQGLLREGMTMDRRMMVFALAIVLGAPSIALGADKAKEQAEVRKAGQDALAAVYKRRRRRARRSSPRPAMPHSATSE